jgi:pimeloyl-ACP methyl ester carboxylesterase
LHYSMAGDRSGSPVIFMHGGYIPEEFKIVLTRRALSSYRMVAYRRRGYVGSSPLGAGATWTDSANDCAALMKHLGITRAHLVAHCQGGPTALTLARRHPELVQSLALLEAALPPAKEVTLDDRDRAKFEELDRADALFANGQTGEAFDLSTRVMCGADGLDAVRVIGEWETAVSNMEVAFVRENQMNAAPWLTTDEAATITQPILWMLGERSPSTMHVWQARHERAKALFPHAQVTTVPHAGHLLPIQNPDAVAAALSTFFARHAMPSTPEPGSPGGRNASERHAPLVERRVDDGSA